MIFIYCNCLLFYSIIQENMIVRFFFLLVVITLQQCPSEGVDYSSNQLSNGNFQTPSVGLGNPPLTFPGGVGPWTCALAEIGNGVDYNSNWGVTQVAALDTGVNQDYTQSFTVSFTGRFFFSLDFTKRQGFSPSTSGLRIYWNGRNVAQQPTSSDDLIHSITLNVTSAPGVNTLIIQAMGHDDGEGTTIDNVGVYPIREYHKSIINGVCSCAPEYFDNGYNYACVPCAEMAQYCLECNLVPDLTLLSANCLANIDSGAACSNGTFTCTLCQSGYYTSSNGKCQTIQIIPNFYEPSWNLSYIPCNKINAKLQVHIPQYLHLLPLSSNNTNMSIIKSTLSSATTADDYIIDLEGEYSGDISTQIITFIVYYTDVNGNVNSVATVVKMMASNVPLVYYTQDECESVENVQSLVIAIVVLSYVVMFFSTISLKIVGLELFGVLQLAFFTLASHDKVNIYLQPLLKWKYVNGYNIETTQPSINVPSSLNLMGYKDNFFFNINFMLGVLFLDIIVGVIAYRIAKVKQNKKLMTISLYILKLGFITLFLFNSLNLSFSIGTHFKYASNQATEYYWLGTIGAGLGIVTYIFAVIYMQVTREEQFGEYKCKFKKNCINRFYIPLSIISRFILGIYIAEQNEWYLSTLVILGISIAFIMFNLINLPFKKAYQNYRANLCHFTQFVILLVTNYYRSMKYNLDMNQKGRIYWPAIVQLVLIFICIFVSAICLVYQIVVIIKEYRAERMAREKVQDKEDKNIKGIPHNQSSVNKTEQEIINDL